jgi:hypothetical protein
MRNGSRLFLAIVILFLLIVVHVFVIIIHSALLKHGLAHQDLLLLDVEKTLSLFEYLETNGTIETHPLGRMRGLGLLVFLSLSLLFKDWLWRGRGDGASTGNRRILRKGLVLGL